MTDAPTYGQILGRNISAARGRLQLRQAALAQRMRVLGFPWQQQTAAAVEKAKRRPTAEEVLGLALCLETTIPALMSANDQDGAVTLPNGQPIGAVSVERLAGRGVNDRAVRWHRPTDAASYTVFRRLPGVDPFDPEWLSQPPFAAAPDRWHPGEGESEA